MMSRVLFLLLFYHFILTSGRSSDPSCSHLGQFQCKDGTCVSYFLRCDQNMDCDDGSDEDNCENYKGISCDKTRFFECKNGRCISNFFKCDQEDDCGDNSDEEDCVDKEPQRLLHKCTKDEFQCRDKLCIPLADFCNKQQDCLDGTDEYDGCEKMLSDIPCSGFKCKTGMCISSHWRCDGINDCSDNSDELSCETAPMTIQECNTSIDWFLCNNSRCIPLNLTCNNKNDCGDGSDEGGDCKNVAVNCKSTSHNCEQICRNTPRGASCACRSGFRLENNKCTDIDECNNYGVCSQVCVNIRGSYYCSCDFGYELADDKTTCKVKAKGGEALMIFSTKTDIRGYYLNSEVYFYVARNLQHVVGVSKDTKHIYWTNMQSGEESIMRSLDDGTNREMIVTAGLGSPEDLSVDWVTGNIYFTDSAYKRIGVCNNDGSYCTVIISEKVEKPRGIVLHPADGLMYWSDWGDTPHISVAEMDGKGRKFFVTKDLFWPGGLTIDKPNKRLYWVDAKLRTIESIRLDGTDRRIILKDIVKSPNAIEVFEDKLYFSDWALNEIHSCNKFTGKDFKTLFREKETVYGLHIDHSVLKMKYGNPCLTKPCSQLCLLAANRTYSCACTLDHELTYDKHTCKESLKQGHLLIGAGNQLIDYYHEILGQPKMTASLTLKHVTDLAYDSITDTVFVADQLTDSLFSFNPHSGEDNHILSIQNQYMGGMDFDYIGNNLFWSNTEFNSIEVYSMRTQSKFDIPFQNQPREIALVPENGIMYVVFQEKNKEYHIARMDLAGSSKSKTIVIKNNLIGPRIPLAFDFEKKRLYWADEGAGRIDSISQNGDHRILFRTGLNKPVSLSILGGFVFWTQRGAKKLFWSDKSNAILINKALNIRVADNLEVMHLVSLHRRSAENHACSESHGSLCSHICIVTNIHGYTCECPYGMSLKKDGKTCEQRTCQSDEWKCMRTGHCISRAKKCDGRMDCPGGEDEISCNSTNKHCSFSQFQCENNQCIDIKKHCDSNYDCADGSDEQNCMRKLCNDDEFQCHDRSKCIFKSLLCNGYNDCSDTSDEIDCSSHICDTNEFKCKSGMCIPNGWVCDGQPDCLDGSDESENCSSLSCTSSMFHCKNGHCVDTLLICNGNDDCGDNSDEEECVHHKICGENQYKCSGTETCISERLRCNGFPDCQKGDDEQNCVKCGITEFKCDNGKCIYLSWVCDQINDCGDNSDEKSCSTPRQATVDVTNSSSCQEFQCGDGTCLAYKECCDGVFNCGDLSDENGQCATACNEPNPCEHVCMKTPNGPVCRCNVGYFLRDDKKSCEDINECDFNEKVCTHMCINTPGSYKCDCFQGYQLRSNRRSCKSVEGVPMTIITTSNQNIWKFSADGHVIKNIISRETNDITGLDVNVATNTIYWSIAEQRKLSRYDMDTEIREDFQINEGHPELLSLDWATENIYVFVNSYVETNKCIKVCNMDQKNCALLISIPEGDHVYSLVVDPVSGFFFWSQARNDFIVSAIYRAEMTGTKVTPIISSGLHRVPGITVDHVRSRIYWCDNDQQVIEGSNFDGSDRQVIFREGVYRPVYLNLYEDYLYWLESAGRKLHSCALFLGETCTEINLGSQDYHNFVVIMQKARQPSVENRCKQHNCEHMCVLTAESSACLCEGEEFPMRINGTCSSNFSIHDRESERQESSLSRGGLLSLIFIVVVVVMILGYCQYKYGLFHRCLFTPFRSFTNRVRNHSELQYASHYNNNSNSSGVDISTEIINPTYNERHHQQQQQREQDLLQPEQGQQLQSMPTPKKLVKPPEMKPNFFDESPTSQDDISLIPESSAKFKY